MPKYFSVRDYDKYQHYKDRTPPWIKLYNHILDDDDFEDLPDTTKYHFLAITLLASRTNNKMKYDPAYIKRKISAKTNVNLDLLKDSEFIKIIGDSTSNDSKTLAEREQDASTEREKRERREEKIYTCFSEFWNLYPKRKGKRLGKPEAVSYFKNNVKPSDQESLLIAVKNYADSSDSKNGYAKDAHRWLRDWQQWLTPEEVVNPNETDFTAKMRAKEQGNG